MKQIVKIAGRDHQLEDEPVNLTLAEVVAHLRRNIAHPVWVCLEPGDATRYEFMLVWQRHIVSSIPGRGIPTWGAERPLLAVRFVGGYAVGSTCLGDSTNEFDFEEFAQGNRHTMIVMEWWFNNLSLQLKIGQ